MMNSYKIFNRTEFEAENLVSKTVLLALENIGDAEFLITKGNELGLLYLDEFLVINFQGQNPRYQNNMAVFEDENHDIWLGIEAS